MSSILGSAMRAAFKNVSNNVVGEAALKRAAATAAVVAGENPLRPTSEELAAEAAASLDPRTIAPRSALFVPCTNKKALKKVPLLNSDVFILDLEDSVAPSKKADARANLIDVVSAGELKGLRIVVRINSPRTAPQWGFADLDACGVLAPHIEGIVLPKIELGDYDLVKEHIHPDHVLWANFETIKGVEDVFRILREAPVKVATMGNNDLGSDLGLPAAPVPGMAARLGLMYSMSRVVSAAKAARIAVLDGVFNDPTDKKGLVVECAEGRALGFHGKTLIHPDQISIAHDAYSPSTAEVEWAERVVKAVGDSEGGVATVDGKMVEELHARAARELIARNKVFADAGARAAAAAQKHRELKAMMGDDGPKRMGLEPPPPPPKYE